MDDLVAFKHYFCVVLPVIESQAVPYLHSVVLERHGQENASTKEKTMVGAYVLRVGKTALELREG